MTALSTSKDLKEFFRKKIKKALLEQNLDVSVDVEYYLVFILDHFSKSENLFQTNAEGQLEERALALKLYDSVFSGSSRDQFRHLKSLGDTALYRAGVFYDGFHNQTVNIDYYIKMGGSAYHSLANLNTASSRHLNLLFEEMAENFSSLVEVLYLSCEKETLNSQVDLLKLMERYQQTGSQKAKQILEDRGLYLDQLDEFGDVQ